MTLEANVTVIVICITFMAFAFFMAVVYRAKELKAQKAANSGAESYCCGKCVTCDKGLPKAPKVAGFLPPVLRVYAVASEGLSAATSTSSGEAKPQPTRTSNPALREEVALRHST